MTPVKRRKPDPKPAAVAPALTIFGMAADRAAIFCDHRGYHRPRIEKRQRKLIAKSAFVKLFLKPEERLRCLTTGYSPIRTIEKILMGPAILLFKRAFFIFTDRRILHIPTRFNRTPHSTISKIDYADCAMIELSGGTLAVRYKNGRQENFPYIGRPERKRIKALLSDLTLPPKEAHRTEQRTYLCPRCTHPLLAGSRTCSSCKLRFKTAGQALLRALLIPGGGYLFSRHPLCGTITGLLECTLAGLTALAWFAFSSGAAINFGLLLAPGALLLLIKSIAAFHARQLIADRMPETIHFTAQKR